MFVRHIRLERFVCFSALCFTSLPVSSMFNVCLDILSQALNPFRTFFLRSRITAGFLVCRSILALPCPFHAHKSRLLQYSFAFFCVLHAESAAVLFYPNRITSPPLLSSFF